MEVLEVLEGGETVRENTTGMTGIRSFSSPRSRSAHRAESDPV
ncbi:MULTISPECIES: hypothetical protein [unclassified Streptomyces]|nr:MULTISPECIES: hypothetical protein [unclassified Streptomyces]